MTSNLIKLLTTKNIRSLAGRHIYKYGESYYRSGLVEVQSVLEREAHCRVRGTRYYYVHLWTQDDDLGGSCTCPHVESGWFCKHMTAAALEVKAYGIKYGSSNWRTALTNFVKMGPVEMTKKYKIENWLFLSLQRSDNDWHLVPYRIIVDAESRGILPDYPSKIGVQLLNW